jgi:hypothetical protein
MPRATRTLSLSTAGSILLALAFQSSAPADPPVPASAPTEKQAEKPGSKDAPPTKDAPKSLDDLLGVPQGETGGGSAEDAARREQEKRLEKSLDESSMSDLVQRALEGMKTASDRLSDAKDPGLGTQRVQEDVVKTLDRLLQEAQRRQSKSSSSSKSSGKRDHKQDPSEQNGQQQKQQQQKKPSKSSQTSSSSDSNNDSREGTRDDAVAQTQELNESRIEWGRLPERVRELVLQGRRDRVSTIYERLTREYYRRLAEEASR